MKQIIADSKVSQAHFYKVVNGERKLSPQLRLYFASLLDIPDSQVALLIPKHPKLTNKNEKGILVFIKNPTIILLLASFIVAALAYWKLTYFPAQPTSSTWPDRSKFIKDVTIPDGTQIKVGTSFVKTWRIKNVGNTTWKNRFLMRTTINSIHICRSAKKVPINTTAPGETVDISVTFYAPILPGSCRTDWKMVNANGKLIFPELQGLYSIVQIVQ